MHDRHFDARKIILDLINDARGWFSEGEDMEKDEFELPPAEEEDDGTWEPEWIVEDVAELNRTRKL